MYSRNNIKEAIKNGHIQIYPYEEKNLTGIGYNLSTTNFAFSVSKGVLLAIRRRISENGVEHYVVIPPHDTVLFFSKEYIAVDDTLAGTIHSKVSSVSQGLGHISTTLDPTWKGQLLISVNNPTNEKIEFDLDKNSGNLLTMLVFELKTKVTGSNIHDNNQGRCDLLLRHFKDKKRLLLYKKKHLELESFITEVFSSSLNGYDDFITDQNISDKYSEKLTRLLKIQSRMQDQKILFQENRYEIEPGGEYQILIDEKEYELIKDCAIFDVVGISREKLMTTFSDLIMDRKKIIKRLEKCLMIVNYELELINHYRRIEWQNEEVDKFAGEGSGLVRLLELRQVGWIIFYLILGVGMTCSWLKLFYIPAPDNSIHAFIIPVIIAINTGIVKGICKRIREFV